MKKEVQEQFEVLAAYMDMREAQFKVLAEFEKKNGFVPGQYQKDLKFYANYETYKRKGSWRDDKAAVFTIRQAAKLCAKNAKKRLTQ